MKIPSISVIIVSYNVSDLLKACINSIKKYANGVALNIIVVDNNSTDDSCSMLKTLPEVTLIENKFNAGFSAANNQGIAISKGDYIFLLNPDTEFVEDVLSKLIAECSTDKKLVAPKLLNTDGSLQLSCFKFPSVWFIIFESLFLHSLLKVDKYNPTQLLSNTTVDAVSGAAIFFNRSILKKLNGLDADLFWMEDIDFCYRNFKHGGTTSYLADVSLKHHSGKSSIHNYHIVISNQMLSKLKYLRKHGNFISYCFAVLFSVFHVLSRILVFALLAGFSHKAQVKLKAYVFAFKKMFAYILFGSKKIVS
jgi:GT2 family glycosyltransferase